MYTMSRNVEFVNSYIASTAAITLCQPVEVTKVNYQIGRGSIRDTLDAIYRRGGISGFYRGLCPNVATFPVFWSIFFHTNEYFGCKSFMTYYASGSISSAMTNPLFVIKTRMQLHDIGARAAIQQITNGPGYAGFYRGYSATLFNNLKLGIQFPLYEYGIWTGVSVTTAAFGAKLISSSIMYPMDLIRTQQRCADAKLSIIDVIKKIYHTGGVGGFYRGIVVYNCVSIPQFIVMMNVLQYIRRSSRNDRMS